ncbi:hypothetical protein GXM_06575 [Nostoc sphaeroides CCNUC1]|uniref:Uncharacterized protein n=1 Tax=Nostoc sphaeroides CCNUC1 TaxID=2653204 RepID=A0A5P8W964_9NOSO|nr:hypothetical protein GXM_06575 [Nostoc sphaeroides CCNUC1]
MTVKAEFATKAFIFGNEIEVRHWFERSPEKDYFTVNYLVINTL